MTTASTPKTFFRVVTPAEALDALCRAAPVDAEVIGTTEARGRVLAEDLYSRVDLPHFNRAGMDGYAVVARDTFGAGPALPAYLKLAGTVEMGHEATRRLGDREAMRISTGGMLPPGSDAVVMVEHTEETGRRNRGDPPGRLSLAQRHPGGRRHPQGRSRIRARPAAARPRPGRPHRSRHRVGAGLPQAARDPRLHRRRDRCAGPGTASRTSAEHQPALAGGAHRRMRRGTERPRRRARRTRGTAGRAGAGPGLGRLWCCCPAAAPWARGTWPWR